MNSQAVSEAAELIRNAQALVITAGAGMGVDSGLPDFRGDEGFWNAYPPYRRLGVSFIEMANPEHFSRDPEFGWGFYGHRLNLYRATQPHAGFGLLQEWIAQQALPYFVVTSNVDGQFQKAGFDWERVYEVHGSIHHLQCLRDCDGEIWGCREDLVVDEASMRAQEVPRCPDCGGVARPNILMFGDGAWNPSRSDEQAAGFERFLREVRDERLVIVEMGAGSSIPTIRHLTEQLAARPQSRAVRINPRESDIRSPHLSLEAGSLEALQAIFRQLAV